MAKLKLGTLINFVDLGDFDSTASFYVDYC